MADLTAERALIFRIVHRDNVEWILDNGLHCKKAHVSDPNYVAIGNLELIDRRTNHPVPCHPNGTLGDYVPFYFTPFSPMMLNIKTGYGGIRKRANEEIVVLVSSLHKLNEAGLAIVFTDRHAYLQAARFYTDMQRLNEIDWAILRAKDFKRNAEDPGKFERYQAEALVHRSLPCAGLLGIACYNEAVMASVKRQTERRGLNMRVIAQRKYYF